MRLSIRRKIVLFVVMPLIGLYAVFSILDAVGMRRETTADMENRLRELAHAHAERFDSRLREVAQIAKMTAAFIEDNPDLESERIFAQLQANLELSPLVYGSAVCFEPYQRDPDQRLFVRYVYRDGDVPRRLDPTSTGYDYTEAKREYWHVPRETGEALWSDPYFDEGAGDVLMCTYSVPFFRGGDFLGIATVDIPLEPLRELADIKMPTGFTFCVLTRSGKYVYCTQAERINRSVYEVLKREHGNEPVELARAIASGESGSKKLTGWITEARQWVSYTPVQSARWGFAVSIPEKAATSAVRGQFYWDLAFLAASLPLVIFALWLVSLWISRPIVRLCNVAGEIGRGNLDTRAAVAGNDEIGLLADSFNKMVTRLSQREQALQEKASMIESASSVIATADLDGNMTYANPAFVSAWGFDSLDEVLGRPFPEFWEVSSQLDEVMDALIGSGPGRWSGSLKGRRKDGSHLDLQVSAATVYDDKGKPIALMSTSIDITDRKRAEDELRESEERFRSLFENAPLAYQSLDENGDFIKLNETWCNVLGYTKQEVLGRNFSEFIHPDYSEHFRENFPKFKSMGYVSGVEFEMIKKDGSQIIVAFDGTIERYDDGRFKQTHCVFSDITERKRAEEALEKRVVALTRPLDDVGSIVFEDLFNLDDIQRLQDEFAKAAGVASIITRTDGTPVTAPSNFCRLCSDIIRKTDKGRAACFKSDAAIGRFNPDGPTIRTCMSGGLWDAGAAISVGGEHIANWLIGQVRDDTQTEKKMRAYAREIEADEEAVVEAFREVPAMSREQFGRVAQVLFTLASQLSTSAYQNVQQARFITESKRAEEELHLNESRLEALVTLGHMTSGSLRDITDFALEEAIRLTGSTIGYLAFMNKDETVLTMHSWSKTAMAECRIADKPFVYPVESAGLWGEAVRQRKPVITNEHLAPNPLKKGHPEGHVRVTRHMNTPVFDGGRIVAVAGVGNKEGEYDRADVRQLTLLMEGMWRLVQRKRLEKEQEELIAKLEAQNAELERFTYTVSHDLKSPLITIKGYVGMLRKDLANVGSETAAEDLARISSAADKMDQLLRDLLELSRIGRLINPPEDVSLEELARETLELVGAQVKENGVHVEISPDLPVVFGDRVRLREVLQNLIDNAVKYMGDQSQPRVEIGSRRDANQTICYVRDNGIGIEPRYHEKVFGLFDQLDQKAEGTGIGLALAKRIVEVHGGRIWVESEGSGHGSTFCFTIAARSESAEHRDTEPWTTGR